MGLRLVAHYYDRSEAYVARSVIADAGMLAVIPNDDVLRMLPYFTMAFGGYRLLVPGDELDDAVALLQDAIAHPLQEGEVLVVEGDFLDRTLSFFLGYVAGGAPLALRNRKWLSLPHDGHNLA